MELKKTNSSTFMVPTLKIGREKLEENNFLNGYSRDIDKEVNYENSVYLLFKPGDFNEFNIFLDEEYERTPHLIEDYNHEGGFIVLVYTLDPKYKEDFDLVRNGRYSKTSKEFQELFPKVIKIIKNGLHKDELSAQYRIFNKTEDLKEHWEGKLAVEFKDDMELWRGWDEEEETLNIEKIKKLI